MDFKNEYQQRINDIDSYIEKYLNNLKGVEPILVDGMKYAVLNGGKRLRSILCTEICCAFNKDKELALPYAAAIEFIHAYSLVHDDLPAMDNADFRRGMPSCHKKYGEDIAILIGDSLLNIAYEIMLENVDTIQNGTLAMKTIASSAGCFGMVNGQVKDLKASKSKTIDEDNLLQLIEQKTMALIRGAAISGATIAGCSDDELEIVDKFAYNLGLAFQIRDDFEDFEEDDLDEHACPNFINVLGKEQAKSLLIHNVNEMTKHLNMIENNEFLKEMCIFLFPEIKNF